MRCGCPFCGAYTVQIKRGMDSLCKCPECGWECRDCMANGDDHFSFMDREKVAWMKHLADELKENAKNHTEENDK